LVRNGENIFIRVGDYDLSVKYKSKTAQTQKVSTTYIHHNHNGQTLDNDIALLKMQSPVEMNDHICLTCLPARGSNRKPGQRCTVTGYGYIGESELSLTFKFGKICNNFAYYFFILYSFNEYMAKFTNFYGNFI